MKEEERAIVLENENTNVEPIPVGTGGGKPQPEMDALSSIVKDFNDTYGNIEWKNFCNAIHADEENPELMFQNYDAFPRKWYDESSFDEDSFNTVKDYSDLCDKYSPDAVDAFIDWGCEELIIKVAARQCSCKRSIALTLHLISSTGAAKNSNVSRTATSESGTAKKTSPGTSSTSATISKARWATLPATSTTKAFGRDLFMYDYSMGANNNVCRNV